ncbi:MAG TPA: ABC transporter permease [Acidimicrobiales bacterium]|nr:ABC transporter permease [Acidimicrobiales bacterium]
MTPYIVGGLVLGGIYAISALGLTMTYISSRVLNFAHGGIAFFVAMTFYRMYGIWHWPLLVAEVVSIGVVGPAIGLFLWLVLARNLARASTVVMLVATVGLYVALTPLTFLVFSDNPIFQRPGLAGNHVSVYHIAGVALNSDQLLVFIGTIIIGIALALMLRFTTAGLLIRAVVDSPSLSGLAGTDPRVVGAASWALGCGLAGLSGVMLTPLVGLDATAFTLLIVASLAAVVVARLGSLALAFAGALLLGLIQDISIKYLPSKSIWASGFRPSVPFIVMMVFLVAYQGFGRSRSGAVATSRVAARGTVSDEVTTGPHVRQIGFAVIVGLVVVVSLILPHYWVGIVGSGVCLGIALLSYSVVTGQGGIISLCQISFAGLGAVFTAQLATNNHWPGLVALFVAGLLVVPVALLVALVAVRLGDLYVALATLAFALLVDNLIFPMRRFDQDGSGMLLHRPHFFGIHFDGDRSFLYLGLVIFVLLSMLVRNLRTSTTGMTLVAIRSSETGVSTVGHSVVRSKLVAFGVSGFIAAIGGGMLGFYGMRARPESFSTLIGIVWLAVVITLGVRTSAGPLLAGMAFVVFPSLIGTWHWPHWALQLPPVLFGLGAIGLARDPRGAVAQASNDWIRLAQKIKAAARPQPPPPEAQDASASAAAVSLK